MSSPHPSPRMTSIAQPRTAILHASPTTSTVLIDIPLSIALAQHLTPPLCSEPLKLPLSTPALTAPYPSTEPKSKKARQRVIERLGDDGKAVIDEDWIREELDGVRRAWTGEWCTERKIGPGLTNSRRKRRKRKKSDETKADAGDSHDEVPVEAPNLCYSAIGEHSWEATHASLNPLILPAVGNAPREHLYVYEAGNRLVSNDLTEDLDLTLYISENSENDLPNFILPPLSSFFLSNIDHRSAQNFSQSAFKLLPEQSKSAGPGQFNLVLLDPPWSNRSVRRSKRYEIMKSRKERSGDSDPLLGLKDRLGQHIAPGGLVGCWITNKAMVREEALRLFDSLGVELEEEWVWLKVTSQGEPVTELEGLWRKPYEILLLGRKAIEDVSSNKATRRRLLIAVPDLHSRKPNLKELFEPMLPDSKNYRGLELFARTLTAGWWAWGDECLRYNWSGFWFPQLEA